MYNTFTEFLENKQRICIIQAENPDGDSLGSALALDYLLEDKDISLYCPVEIPKYLHYMPDWSRVTKEFDFIADGYIIVDTAADILLSKLLDDLAIKKRLNTSEVFVLDHHETEDDLSFAHKGLIQILPACCDLIYKIAIEQDIKINAKAAEYLMCGILSDTLGLTSMSTTSDTLRVVAELIDCGVNISDVEENRRDFMKKSQKIFNYKADLIKRTEFFMDGTLATVHIPWSDIKEYSDDYNPNVLILEELRLVEGIEVAACVKTYPDGKVTGKIRGTKHFPYADELAEYFGGGGHPYAAGFRTYDINYDEAVHELIDAIYKIKKEHDETL
ncbi:DHH family phosphoesterase [Candidatus Saccharibacteria bacterium]|nr:DHH family phosphoesterase [Candidatus Saccharibacteria bacterium]